jgi:hypothetical protein
MKRNAKTIFRVAAVVLAAGAASAVWAGQKAKPTDEPQVKAVSSPEFKPADFKRVAIVWPERHGWGGNEKTDSQRAMEDEFTSALMEKGYSVVSRSDVVAVLKEQKFQNESGLTDADASKIGKLLNVPAVMVVSISDLKSERYKKPSNAVNLGIIRLDVQDNDPNERPKFANRCSMGARLLSVEKGEILWFGKTTAISVQENPQDFSESVQKAAAAVAQAIPTRNPPLPKTE